MKKIILIIFGLIFLYRDSFFAKFFQDDFILLNLAKTTNAFIPIANFPYRPLSIQVFYSFCLRLFGENPMGYHIVLFILFAITLVFIYKISNWQTVFLYAFNISLFPLFYWVATSYFVFAAFFVFGAAYFYKKQKYVAVLLFFLLGLLSNEIVVVLPALLFLFKPSKKVIPFFGVSLGYLFLRSSLSAMPKAADYTLDFSLKFLSTFKWYFLRVFNLPEGRAAADLSIYLMLVVLFICLLLAIKNFSGERFIFALGWFFIGALPFFFLPNHMSSYYLTISLFGPAVFFADIFKNNKIFVAFCCVYLIMAFLGLNNLSQTHWIILKP